MACDVHEGIGASLEAPIRALSINEQAITQRAWVNDFGLGGAMPNQLEQAATPCDAVLAISSSSNKADWSKATVQSPSVSS